VLPSAANSGSQAQRCSAARGRWASSICLPGRPHRRRTGVRARAAAFRRQFQSPGRKTGRNTSRARRQPASAAIHQAHTDNAMRTSAAPQQWTGASRPGAWPGIRPAQRVTGPALRPNRRAGDPQRNPSDQADMSWRMLAILTIVVEQGQRSTRIINAMATRHLDRSDQDLDINELESDSCAGRLSAANYRARDFLTSRGVAP
jgi:hypothetical protein